MESTMNLFPEEELFNKEEIARESASEFDGTLLHITPDTKIIRQRICKIMREAGINQKQLGNLMGISSSMVSRKLRSIHPFSMEELYSLARYFSVSTDWILGLDPDIESIHRKSIVQNMERANPEIWNETARLTRENIKNRIIERRAESSQSEEDFSENETESEESTDDEF